MPAPPKVAFDGTSKARHSSTARENGWPDAAPAQWVEDGPGHWSDFFDANTVVTTRHHAFQTYSCGNEGPLVVYLHGAGFSGLSFACLHKEMHALAVCRGLAIDLRDHGATVVAGGTDAEEDGNDSDDMSLDALAMDVKNVVDLFVADEAERPFVVLVGHSMGGALAVRVASCMKVAMVVMIDVVESNAIAALPSMRTVLEKRPNRFVDERDAIAWALRTRYINNRISARISMPAQLLKETFAKRANGSHHHQGDGDDSGRVAGYVWRTNLLKTERFWEGWFRGLTKEMLSLRVPKVIILPNIDRMDAALTVAQMQGLFQLHIVPRTGHAVHEDSPKTVAQHLVQTLARHNLAFKHGDTANALY